MLKTFVSHSREETLALGELIGKAATGGSVIAYRGGLGAGKTTLSKGIALGLGIKEEVTSPTYTIVSEYQGRLSLYHIDAYRLGGEADFIEIGGYEMLEKPGSLCLIEWSEKLPEIINSGTAIVDISVEKDGTRTLSLFGSWLEELLP
ncbi:MAG TPA: tRNA (adenosine(37)-N6)-threonylcarbamoyltransferase complex ATPase subunit type 1 TsaE [Rectinemataceae bacterium]|nr:tRNA (adenosine(37)-N6)-threonylcarbamoyltransferase complex ATPase subunit type 1 TsaE [Rectinemataceae bacterium]